MSFEFILPASELAAEDTSSKGLLRWQELAQGRSHSPISGFPVGAAASTVDGDLVLGVNLEFPGASFSQTVHAEQFLLSLWRQSGLAPLKALAVSAPPCGHCRQFLWEAFEQEPLEILLPGQEPRSLKGLLPLAFGPSDLDLSNSFRLSSLPCGQEIRSWSLEKLAQEGALRAYAPYSGLKAGVALRNSKGIKYWGCSIENAAYNPSLPPLQAALIWAYAKGCQAEDIVEVVLCEIPEKPGANVLSFAEQSRELCQVLAPHPPSFECFRL